MKFLFFLVSLALSEHLCYAQTDSGVPVKEQNFIFTNKSKVNFVSTDFSGEFEKVQGKLGLSEAKVVTGFDLVIDINSLKMNIEGMANHAKSADFFDAAQYPSIVFFGNQINYDNKVWTVSGTMRSKGVAIQRTIPFELVYKKKDEVQINTSFKLLRTDFNIGEEDAVSNEVQINAVLFAKKKP